MLADGGSIDKGQIGSIIYSAKFPLKHHLLCVEAIQFLKKETTDNLNPLFFAQK